MSPRPYRSSQRQRPSEGTTARIVDAARELLADPDGPWDFTVDAVARRAGVSRMTVYYQFGGRTPLLEAVLDDLATRGGMLDIGAAFQQPSAAAAVRQVVAVFCGFWASQRLVLRRLRAMAVLDPELSGVFRDDRRRQAISAALNRGVEETPAREPATQSRIDLLTVLTSFETYDSLAAGDSDQARVTALLQQVCALVLNADLDG
jgi:AcrR family transcriptional regulator